MSSFLKKRKTILIIIDLLMYAVISNIALAFCKYSLGDCISATALLIVCVFLVRACFRVYRQVWRYAGAKEYLNVIIADFIGGVFYLLVSRFMTYVLPLTGVEQEHIPDHIFFWQALTIISLGCIATLTTRNLYQLIYSRAKRDAKWNWITGDGTSARRNEAENNKINVAIIGAGSIGTLLADELKINRKAHYKPCCFIDKDPQKVGNIINGLRVYSEIGILDRLKSMPVQEVIVALPNLTSEEKQNVYDFYKQSNCKVKLFDFAFSQEAGGDENKRVLRDFAIEDLLFRDPIRISNAEIASYYKNRVVLITGGGGSIGSELCRQIAKFGPKQLIVFDCYENNAYDIQQELTRRYGDTLDVQVEISSVREAARVDAVFRHYRPDVVLHAAAHKHVPLMEHNGAEAIKNNVFGTLNVVNAAEKYKAAKFIMISTDKAVNPTNIMGASKRMCEMIVQSRGANRKAEDTEYAAVRFGNVLGSNGSVIPLFKHQIATGGPVTITDKRIIRYFMTIPEAAQLVLQAGAMAKNGELFALDMGKPIRILDLAENMIRLSGLTPYVDIDIKEIGLRDGEKLYEELLVKTEELDKTDNELIFVERDKAWTRAEIDAKLAILQEAADDGSTEAAKDAFRKTISTYHQPDEVNCNAGNADEMRNVKRVAELEIRNGEVGSGTGAYVPEVERAV